MLHRKLVNVRRNVHKVRAASFPWKKQFPQRNDATVEIILKYCEKLFTIAGETYKGDKSRGMVLARAIKRPSV